MTRWIVMGLMGALLLTEGVAAQTTTTQPSGAFDRLSPGNQKIARALFEAQPAPESRTAGATTPTPWTLDEIAAHKQSGQGWGNVFKDMKAQGLVQDKNLGQVVSRSSRHHGSGAGPSGTLITTASGRTQIVGGRVGWERGSRGVRSDDDHGRSGRGYSHERAEQGSHAVTGRGGEHGGHRGGGGSSHGGGRGK